MQLLIASIILLGGVTTTQAEFVTTPTSVNTTLGSTATFNCSTNASGVTVVWLVNGSVLSDLNDGITAQQNGRNHSLYIPATEQYNNTSVVCELTIRDFVRSTELSHPAVLKVQGLLSTVKNLTVHSQWSFTAVENLTVHSHQSFINLTWTPPFSLDITGVDPDLWYCVELYNISQGRSPLTTNCSVYEPQFYFTVPNHSRCCLFEFTVFAVNAVGNGSKTSVNGTFHAKPTPVAVRIQGEFISTVEMEVKLLFLSPLATHNGRVFATNTSGSTSLGGVEGIGISNLVVHITDCILQFNHNYTLTMEVGEGDRSMLKLGDLSTFDIKTAQVNNNSPGAVNVICAFAVNSEALGCLVVLHPWTTTQTEIFAYAVRVSRHSSTANVTIHGVPGGNYTMLVFDGEYNGLLSEQAAIAPQNVTIRSGSLEPLRENSELSASINTTDNQICVSCPDDGVSKGCVVVLRPPQELQLTMSYKILRSERRRCFHQEQSGDYTVTVFEQTMNNALYAYPLNVSVVSVFSTPTTPTTPITPTTPTTPIRHSITPITRITDVAPTTLTTVASLEIAVVVTGASVFVIGALVGILLYHCISKHRSQLKPESPSHHQQQQADPEYELPESSSHHQQQQADPEYELPESSSHHQQQQADPEYELPESSSHHQQQQADPEYELPVSSGAEITLRENIAYEPVQRIELRGNVAYEPVQH